MKAKNLCVYAGLCAGVASMATGQVQKTADLQKAEAGQKVTPNRIAKVAMQDGKVVFQSDWMDYTGGNSRATNVRVFDCFGDVDSDGFMDDSGGCGLSSSRWWFGSGYCNMFFTNDMTVVSDTVLADGMQRVDLAWFWIAGGSGTSEYCMILVFTQDSAPCDPDSFDYSGWILDYGTLPSGVGGGYYYSNVDITPGAWTIPTGGSGSYFMIYAQGQTTSGAFVLATCAQPMLWGTGDAGGATDMVGTSGPLQFDDDVAGTEGTHTSSECYSYSYTSLCPSVLGGMAQFWGNRDVNGCYADCNGDNVVNTQDFLCYLNLWTAQDPAADCNGDNVINTQDFLCYLNLWTAGC